MVFSLEKQLQIIHDIKKEAERTYLTKNPFVINPKISARFNAERCRGHNGNAYQCGIKALKDKGYILVDNYTLQEWQKYFTSIFDSWKLAHPEAPASTRVEQIFTDEEYNKLFRVITCLDEKTLACVYTFDPVNIFQRDFKFPPYLDSPSFHSA